MFYFISTALNHTGQQWNFCMNNIGLCRYEGSSKVIFLKNIIFLNISLSMIQGLAPDTHILIFLLMCPMGPLIFNVVLYWVDYVLSNEEELLSWS